MSWSSSCAMAPLCMPPLEAVRGFTPESTSAILFLIMSPRARASSKNSASLVTLLLPYTRAWRSAQHVQKLKRREIQVSCNKISIQVRIILNRVSYPLLLPSLLRAAMSFRSWNSGIIASSRPLCVEDEGCPKALTEIVMHKASAKQWVRVHAYIAFLYKTKTILQPCCTNSSVRKWQDLHVCLIPWLYTLIYH